MVLWTCGKEIESFGRAEGGKRGLCFISFGIGEKYMSSPKEMNRTERDCQLPPLASLLTLVLSFLHQLSNRLEAEGYLSFLPLRPQALAAHKVCATL